jgi:hypothetical protein
LIGRAWSPAFVAVNHTETSGNDRQSQDVKKIGGSEFAAVLINFTKDRMIQRRRSHGET